MPHDLDAAAVAAIERLALIEGERKQLRDLVKELTGAVRSLLALHNPKEASSYEAQKARSKAESLVALVDLLPRTVTPTS